MVKYPVIIKSHFLAFPLSWRRRLLNLRSSYADEALKYQPWTYGQLLSCMPSKLRMVVLLARVFCSVSHCITGSQSGEFLGSFGLTYLTSKPAISFEHKIRHLRMTYSFRTFITMFQATYFFLIPVLAITFFDIYLYVL